MSIHPWPLRPSEATIRAKHREIAIRYRASGYKPTIADLRRAELTRLAVFRRDFEYPGGELLYGLDDNPPKLKSKTLGRKIQLTDFERAECRIRTIFPYDVTPQDHLLYTIAERRRRQRLYAQKKRRAQGAIPRMAYQKASLAQQKPWAAMGLSRRTWYRQGKPMPTGTGLSTHTLTYLLVDALVPTDCCPF